MDKNEFAKAHLGLVRSCCKRFTGKGVEYDELYSAGCLGLAKAINNFDESRGLQFSTYAFPVIMGELKRLFRDGGSVRVSRSLKELSLKINRLNDQSKTSLGYPIYIDQNHDGSLNRQRRRELRRAAAPLARYPVRDNRAALPDKRDRLA